MRPISIGALLRGTPRHRRTFSGWLFSSPPAFLDGLSRFGVRLRRDRRFCSRRRWFLSRGRPLSWCSAALFSSAMPLSFSILVMSGTGNLVVVNGEQIILGPHGRDLVL